MNDAAVLLTTSLAWPAAVLIIVVVMLLTQRQPIGRLIDRVKKVRYPGGEADLEDVLPDSSADTISMLVDLLPRNLRDGLARDDGEPVADDRTIPTPNQNREPVGKLEPLPTVDVANLVVLRTKVEILLGELAFPPPQGGFGPIGSTIDVLQHRGVLDAEPARTLADAMKIAEQAAEGATVPRRLANSVENSGPAILEQLALLRTVAPAMFEEHVIDTLQRLAPENWSIEIDAAFPSKNGQQGARVDALVVTDDKQRVVVEVRARLHAGSRPQLTSVTEWLAALPTDLPVVLVLLGAGLRPRQLAELREQREGPVRVVLWDRESDDLLPMLRGVLATTDVSA